MKKQFHGVRGAECGLWQHSKKLVAPIAMSPGRGKVLTPIPRDESKLPGRLTRGCRSLDEHCRRAYIRVLLARANWGGGRGRGKVLVCSSLLFLLPLLLAGQASANQNDWKTYLKQTVGDEYKCYRWIIYKESSDNPKAVNGSHYGLPQGRSRYLATATPVQQIKFMKKYVTARYKTCEKAKAHHLKFGWY